MWYRFLFRQYRKVYRYDNWMRRHFTLHGHIIVIFTIAAAVFGVDTKQSNTYQLFVFLLIILILALFNSVFNRLKLQLNRNLPRYGTVGEPFNYTVNVTNLTGQRYHGLAFIEALTEEFPAFSELSRFYQLERKPKWQRSISFNQWRDYLAYQRGGRIAETLLPELAHKPIAISVSFTPLRRGKVQFSNSYIAKPDLLGLYRRLIPVSVPQTCLILPKRYPLKPLNLNGQRKYQVGGVSLANSIGNSTEFMNLRDYQHGDPLNKIHWKSFAKHGKLIVKDYQDEYFVRRALLLDTFIGNASVDMFEAAVSVAASLAMVERQQEALLDLMFVGEETYCFTTGRGIDHLPHLQEILASVQGCNEENFLQLQQAVLNRIAQCSSFVCVLMQWDENRQQLVKKLTAHQLPVTVFLLHDGSMTLEQCANKPQQFYLLNYHQLGAELAAL